MSELQTDFKTPQRTMASPSALAPIAPAALASRRRLVRVAGLLVFVFGLGASVIPRPKESKESIELVRENGVTTSVHKYSYSRWFGFPFAVAKAELHDPGGIKNLTINNTGAFGIFGNLVVALALVVAGSLLAGRRRRDG